MTYPWWLWLAVLPGAIVLWVAAVLLRRVAIRRARVAERYETIMDFLPEDDHAYLMRVLDMEHVEGRWPRCNRAIDLGGRRLLHYVTKGYKMSQATLEHGPARASES